MNNTGQKLPAYLLAGILILFAIGAFFVSRVDGSAMGESSSAGLVSLKVLAEESVPYEDAIKSDKPTFLEFYADWCTTCQMMAPALREFHKQYESNINFVMLNVDDPQWAPKVKQYKVTSVPQYVFLKSDREVARTLVGMVPESVLVQNFEQLLNSSR